MATATTKIRQRVDGQHKPGCFALQQVERGEITTPFCAVAETTWRFDRAMRRTPKNRTGQLALAFACNDPDCPCRLIVNGMDLMEMLAAAAE